MTITYVRNSTRDGGWVSVGGLVCFEHEPDTKMLLTASHGLVPAGSTAGDAVISDAQQVIGRLRTWTGVSFGLGYPNVADAALVTLDLSLNVEEAFGPVLRRPFAARRPEAGVAVALAGSDRTYIVRDSSRECLIPWSTAYLGYDSHIVADPSVRDGDSGGAMLDGAGQIAGLVVGITDPQSDLGLQCTAITPIAAVAGHPAWGGHQLQPWGIPAPLPPQPPILAPPDDDTLKTLAFTLWGEARGELPFQQDPDAGMKAVASVILNRLAARRPFSFGSTLASVCTFRPNAKYHQFSCWNSDDPNFRQLDTAHTDAAYSRAERVARLAIAGQLPDITQGATHYYASTSPEPYWAVGHTPCAVIGNHRFYNDVA